MTAVNKTMTWGMSVAASAVALAMFSVTASAQLAPTPPAAPAAPKAAAPAPAAPVAPKAVTPAPAAPVTAKGAVPAKPAAKAAAVSACKGLDEAGCTGKGTECAWIVPKKIDAKSGKADAAYCRKVAGVAKKAADAKAGSGSAAAAPKGSAAPAAAAPKGSAAPAVAPAAPAAPAVKKN
jgi:hypothetical protein